MFRTGTERRPQRAPQGFKPRYAVVQPESPSPHRRWAVPGARGRACACGGGIVGLWAFHPPASRANGEKDKEKGGHAHVPAPLEYADIHVPLSVWTDAAMIARGKEIYATR